MFNRRSVLTACGVAVLGLVVASSGHAFFDGRRTHLTFSGAVALPGVILPAGAYTFERVDAAADRNIVRVLSRDRSKVYFMAFTTPIQRPAGIPAGRFVTFGEAPAGTPPPITAWYPAVDSATGQQFNYR